MNLVKINSINIWDEEMELGVLQSNGTTGASPDRLTSKNYIEVNPSTTYYFKTTSTTGRYAEYDANKNLVYYNGDGPIPNSTFTTSANTKFIKFSTTVAYGIVYKYDTQICLNSESEKTTYHPHWVLGLDGQGKAFTADISSMLPSGIGVVDLGELNWSRSNVGDRYYFYKNGIPNFVAEAEILCEKYRDVRSALAQDKTMTSLFWGVNNAIQIRDDSYTDATAFKNANAGVLLFYKKA